jgi:hypothetical protein
MIDLETLLTFQSNFLPFLKESAHCSLKTLIPKLEKSTSSGLEPDTAIERSFTIFYRLATAHKILKRESER